MGTLTLPGPAPAKGFVAIYTAPPPAGTAVTSSAIASLSGGTSIDYQIPDVPLGTFYMVGFLDVDGSGLRSSTPGDYEGWYGHTGDGNPPEAPNVVLREVGTFRFDFTLVER